MQMEFDFECFENWRGWAVIRPLSDAARDFMAEPDYAEAAELAERFGPSTPGTTGLEYWFDPRDGLEVTMVMIVQGMTCRGSDLVQKSA